METVSLVVEFRKKGQDDRAWRTWAFVGYEHGWRKHLPRPESRTNLEFQLVRRTAVITDEILDRDVPADENGGHVLVASDNVSADERNHPDGYVYCAVCLRPLPELDKPCGGEAR